MSRIWGSARLDVAGHAVARAAAPRILSTCGDPPGHGILHFWSAWVLREPRGAAVVQQASERVHASVAQHDTSPTDVERKHWGT